MSIVINSDSLESVPSVASGPRPQSVTSIHTATPTNTYEELQDKLESSNRNIIHIKEQQQQLLRIQQAAKNQLYEMEQLRSQQGPLSFNAPGASNANAMPDYDNVEEVTQDVTALMSRMKALTDFIHNQNDLASSLGIDEKSDLISEQTQLQNKLAELKNKKQQMANLVTELQSMNIQADSSFDEDRRSQSTERARVTDIPLERIDALSKANVGDDDNEEHDDDEDDEEVAEAGGGGSIQDKIAEINAMKNQLKRLQDMMHTVKLIEIKNGDYTPDDEVSDEANNVAEPSNEDVSEPNCLEEEREMTERVRMLHNMTNDLRQQAVSLAAERDRLKDIKNEMSRRRDFDGSEKNFKQLQNHLASPNISQKDHSFDLNCGPQPKRNDGSINSTSQNPLDKGDLNESAHIRKDQMSSSQHSDNIFFSPNNWTTPTRQNASSTPSIRSVHGACNQSDISTKAPLSASNLGKDSADSGAADVLNMSVEAASSQSCSSRGFSVPPPMRSISGRESAWRKASHDIPRVSSLNNQVSANYENQTEQNYPWYWNYGQSCSSGVPQSPHCHYHHHMCMPSMNVPPTSNDPMLLQQFIQTQQMLINSISQCNQLLWDQQREINNLNSAVLLIQDRLINSNAAVDAQSNMRAESVPPNVVCTNQAPFLPRAQSEQPGVMNYTPSMGSPAMPPSPFRQYSNVAVHSPGQQPPQHPQQPPPPPPQYYRNNQQNVRMLRQPLLNGGSRSSHGPSSAANGVTTGAGVAIPFYDTDQLNYSNNFVNAHNVSNHHGSDSPSLTNNASVNNLYQQNLTPTTSSSASNHNATNNVTALNNQVAPGIRANNYYDNFRSYSRQNLLSSSSCKSNEMPDALHSHMTHNNLPLTIGNKFRNQINQNTPPDVLNVNQQRYYHDVLDNFTTNTNFNNLKTGSGSAVGAITISTTGMHGAASTASAITTNAVSAASSSVVITSASSSHPTHPNETSNLRHSIINNHNTNNHNNNNNNNNNNNENRCGDDQKSINSNNFDVNELKQPKMTTKMLQKGTTGGNKRTRSTHELSSAIPMHNDRESAPLASMNGLNHFSNQFAHDLNLTNVKQQSLSKAPPKLFEDLKENVYHEVSALIAANESRPHFLINLFRELQLISSSDPLRKRLMQTFQDVYGQCCEQNGGPNMLGDAHVSTSLDIQNDLENPHHVLAHDENFVEVNEVNCPTPSTSAACVPDIRSTINDGLQSMINDVAAQNEASLCSVLDLTAQPEMNASASALSKTNDLAEADQENTPSMAVIGLQQADVELLDHEHQDESMENASEAIGAVGGVELSALPDLAKISGPKPEF